MRHLTALSWALCLMLFPAMIHAAGPGVITYQGSLTTPDGEPQASGAYDMEFKLWNSASGGDMHWMELHSGANAVVVTNGVFSVNLGSITPFPDDLFATTPHLWIEVAADADGNGITGDEVYSPRVQFTATPYAFHSDNANKLDGLDATAFIKSSEDITLQAGTKIVFPDGSTQDTATLAGPQGKRGQRVHRVQRVPQGYKVQQDLRV